MATIESLGIRISSDSSKAAKAIDSLVGKLGQLNKGLRSVNTGGLRNYARDVGRLSAAVKSLNGIKVNTPNLGGLTSQLGKLSKIDFSELSSGAQPLKDFANALRAFDGLSNISIPKLDTRNINSVINSLGKMQDIDTAKVSQISGTLSQVSGALSAFSSLNLKDSGINNTINALSKLLSVDFGKFNTGSLSKVTRSIGALGRLPDVSSSVNRLIASLAKLANAGAKTRMVATQLPVLSRTLRKAVIDLRSLGNISESTNSFVHAVAQLASAGDKAQKAADGMDDLKNGMMRLFGAMKDAPRISENTIRMTEALAKLSNTSGKVKSSTSDISSTFDKLSSLGEKAAGGISSAFGKLSSAGTKATGLVANAAKRMLSSTKGAFSKLSQAASRAASAVSSSAKSIVSALSGIGRSSSGVSTASHNLGTLIKTVAGLKAVKSLWNFGNEAVGLGSDITEVENVVDVAFGSMAAKAYEFASTATEQFGLSGLAAKEYSGTMMALLKSSGVAQGAAANMSTTLAGLAGDIASFYNIETDEAFYKLRAAIVGETEPMRALGVNMNIVNLEAYAMSQGITKAYTDMTLAEQSLLRYNYLLAKTGDAQGDFARTSLSWANQVRLLRLNLQSISAVIGQGLIAALLPAIQLLNKFMSKLMQAAKVFRDFMYVLTGKKISGSQKGVVNDLAGATDYTTDLSGIGNVADDAYASIEDVADGADDVANGMDDASTGMDAVTGSAKKLEKALSILPFDELNQLAANISDEDLDLPSIKTPSGSTSKVEVPGLDVGDAGIGDLGDIFNDAFEKVDVEPINKWAAAIRKAFLDHDWEGLGKTIADMVNIGLRKIYDAIKAITPRVEDAMKALARVINSLVDNLDWDLLGRTIGAGINLIVKAFNALTGPGGIDFENLGRKLSVGVRGLVDEVNWRELGNAIGNGFMIAWRIADGFIEDMWRIGEEALLTGWAELGNAIGDTVVGIFDRIDFDQIARVLTEGFKGILETATYALNRLSDNLDWIVDKINLGLKRLYDGLKWDSDAGEDMGQKITAFTDAVVRAFNKLLGIDFGLIGQIIGAAITDIVRAFNQLTGPGGLDFERLGRNIAEGLRGLLTEIPWDEFGNALGNGFMAAWNILSGFITKMSTRDNAGMTGWKELGKAVADTVEGLFARIDLGKIGRDFAKAFNGIFESLREFTETMEQNGTWNKIANNISRGLNNAIRGIRAEEAGKALSKFVTDLLGMLLKTAEQTDWKQLGRKIGHFLLSIEWGTIFGQVFSLITEVVGGLFSGLGGSILEKAEYIGASFADCFNRAFEKLREFTESVDWTYIADRISAGLNAAISGIDAEAAGESLNKFVTSILGMLARIAEQTDWKSFGEKVGTMLSKIDWVEVLLDVFTILNDTVGDFIRGFKETTAGKFIVAFGKILLAIKGVKLASGISDVLSKLGILQPKITDVGNAASSSSGNWGKLAGSVGKAKAAVAGFEIGMKLTEHSLDTDRISTAGETFQNLSATLEQLAGQGKITGEQQESLNSVIEELASKGASPVETLYTLRDALSNAGISSSELSAAAETAGVDLSELTNILRDTESGGEAAKLGLGNAGIAASESGAKFGELATKSGEAVSALNSSNFDPVKASLENVQVAAAGVDFGVIPQGAEAATAETSTIFEECGKDVASGLQGGILSKLSDIGSWLKEHLVDPFVDGVKKLFGIRSPSTVMAEIGGFLMAGLLEGMSGSVGSVLEWIGSLPGLIKEKIGDAKEWLKEKGSDALEGFKNGWDLVKESKLGQTVSSIGGYVKDKIGDAKDWIKSKGSDAIAGLKNGWDSAKKSKLGKTALALGSHIKEKVGDAKDWIKDKGSQAIEGLKNGWDTAKNSKLGKSALELASHIKSKVGDAREWLKEKGTAAIGGLKQGWDDAKEHKLGDTVSKIGEYVKGKVGDTSNLLKQKGSEIVSGLKTGFDGGWSSFSITLSGLGTKIRNALPNLMSVGQSVMQGLANGFRSVKIPLPHINVGWNQYSVGDKSFSLPSFGMQWYARGGLFNSASVIGVGEAGTEAVLPLTNARTMSMIASAITSEMDFGFGGGYESPFFENIALYTQKTANWCANIHDELTLQGKTINKILETANDLLESDVSSVAILGGIQAQVKNFPAEANTRVDKLIQTMSETIRTVGKSTTDGIKSGADSVRNSIQSVGESTKAGIESIISLGEQAMQSVAESINSGIEILNNSVTQSAQSIMDGMSSGFNLLSDGINNGINSISQSAQTISNDINNVGNLVSQAIQSMSNDINSGVNNLINSVSQAAQSLATTMSSGFSQLSSSMSSLSSSLNSAAAKTTSSTTKATTAAKQTSTSTKNGTSATSKITNSLTFGTKEAQQAQTKKVASEALNNQIKKIQEGGKNEIKVATENIKKYSHPSDVSRRISEETARINKSVAERIAQLKKAYGLKTGGLVTSPIFTQMGEMYKPEAVLPLTDHRAMSAISESILSNAPAGGGFSKEELVDAIVEGVVMAMMNNSQNAKFPEYIQNNIYYDGEVMARAVSKANYDRDYRYNPAPQF